jgi:hypothetical protein
VGEQLSEAQSAPLAHAQLGTEVPASLPEAAQPVPPPLLDPPEVEPPVLPPLLDPLEVEPPLLEPPLDPPGLPEQLTPCVSQHWPAEQLPEAQSLSTAQAQPGRRSARLPPVKPQQKEAAQLPERQSPFPEQAQPG